MFHKLSNLVNSNPRYFNNSLETVPFIFIPAYRNKESFGDMDILMNKGFFDLLKYNFEQKLKNEFEYQEIYMNNDVWSFDYKEFQIDLIFVELKDFNTSIHYYSYNDLGNLMGRIANKFGTRYGHRGLEYKLKSEYGKNCLFENVLLSKDIKKVFEFLGFDYQKFKDGFDTLTEIFDFVISSKYFNKSIFLYENLNHQNRTRNKKRNSYIEFLAYISNKETFEYEFKEEDEYFFYANNFFPEANLINLKYQNIEKIKKHQEFKIKFNGNLIKENYPDLFGKKLGNFLLFLQNDFKNENEFIENILKLSNEEILKFIAEKYEKYKKSN